jgi:hypothetical protein
MVLESTSGVNPMSVVSLTLISCFEIKNQSIGGGAAKDLRQLYLCPIPFPEVIVSGVLY